jgi:hypothetical protein
MSSNEPHGIGKPTLQRLRFPPLIRVAEPDIRFPLEIEIHRGVLWARSVGDDPFVSPPGGAWRNLADTDPADQRQIAAIAGRFGPLTRAAADKGEDLSVWRGVIDDLRQLTGAWTAEGDVAGGVEMAAARKVARSMQRQIAEDHQNKGGRFVSAGALGWALKTADMAEQWRLAAVSAVWELAPLRRCRFCGSWFSLGGSRADNSFCSPRHRSAFHQKRQPSSDLWAELI